MKADPDLCEDVRLSEICKALANPVRLQIVRYIRSHPGCTGNQILLNLPDDVARAQSTLSQHLKILCSVGLLSAEPDGPATTYLLSRGCLEWLRGRLGELE
ncbi:MAG: helix-turn-helix domain-containing protein [Roseiflexaceae bacterium]|nr:helix-turn-helix domain-containing protein [Roseiflexaceae bacterium]